MITSIEELRHFDGAGISEFPPGFDEAVELVQFQRLVEALEERFNCRCESEAGFPQIQDASLFGWITAPADATVSGRGVHFKVSNFGRLVVVLTDDEKDPGGDNDTEDVATAVEIAEAVGYRPVQPDLLDERYDGNLGTAAKLYEKWPPSWFTRFFDWL